MRRYKRRFHSTLGLSSMDLPLILAALFVFLFLLSLGLYIASKPWTVRVLFFPETTSGKLVGERRFLPPRRGLSSQIELYVRELILGPATPTLDRIVPREVRLQSVISRDREVYVSLSREILKRSTDSHLSFEQTLQAIATGVLYNHPKVRKLYLLVEGQLPGDKYAEGFPLDKKLLK